MKKKNEERIGKQNEMRISMKKKKGEERIRMKK